MSAEIRTTSSTGGQKGAKLARFDLIPVGPLTELAEHYGKGARKYADHQWRRGYEWSKSYSALMRHLTAFWAGEDRDVCPADGDGCALVTAEGEPFDPAEPGTCYNHTGSHHLAAVAWHAFTMLEFKYRYPEHDDRYQPPAVPVSVSGELWEALAAAERYAMPQRFVAGVARPESFDVGSQIWTTSTECVEVRREDLDETPIDTVADALQRSCDTRD